MVENSSSPNPEPTPNPTSDESLQAVSETSKAPPTRSAGSQEDLIDIGIASGERRFGTKGEEESPECTTH